MTTEEKIKLICPDCALTTAPIRALPSVTADSTIYGLYEGAPRFFMPQNRDLVRFPCPAAIGCSWDKNTAFNTGREIGLQCCARGAHLVAAADCLPFVREENIEYLKFSSHPLQSGTLAAEFVRGVQSTGVGVCLAAGGELRQSNPDGTEPDLTERLSSLDYALKAEPRAVLTGGIVSAETVRRKGYDGVCLPPWGSGKKPARLLKEGCDLIFCSDNQKRGQLLSAVENGALSPGDLDDSALKVLRLIDLTYDDHPYELDGGAQSDKSADFAAGCAVLLKNDGILPIASDSVTIAGTGAERLAVWGDEGGELETVSLVKEFSFDRRVKVLAANDGADGEARINETLEHTFPDETVIVVLSGRPDCAGAPSDALPSDEIKLIERLQESGRNVVAVVAACNFDYLSVSAASAVLYAPYLGGGAAAAIKKIICGELSPSGKLCSPLGGLPLGHGLTYSRFSYSDAVVRARKEGGLAVTFTLKNEGRYHAAEAVQLYAGSEENMKLTAFDKIWLRSGESRAVTLETDRLSSIGNGSGITLAVCASASDVRLKLFYSAPSAVKAENDGAIKAAAAQDSKNTALLTSGANRTPAYNGEDLRTAESLKGLAGKIARRKIKKLSLKHAAHDAARAQRLAAAVLKTPLSMLPAQSNGAAGKAFVKAVLLLADGKPFAAFKRALSKKD